MLTTRRNFLVAGLRVAAIAPFVPVSSVGALSRAADGDRALVVVQLTGGNDGLNTVVPFAQDSYVRLRPTLAFARTSVHALDDTVGLHPELVLLGKLFDEGKLAIVQGVGLPKPERSHFRSMEIWHCADPDGPPRASGWMGRLADQIVRDHPGTMAALHIGDEDLPLALFARETLAPTVRGEAGFDLLEPDGRFTRYRDELARRMSSKTTLAFLHESARQAYRAARAMSEAAERSSVVEYPDHALARKLRLVARLVSAGFGARLFHVALAGFDTHARQGPTHAALLAELAQSLAAFQRDLEASGVDDRVATFVFSEFGRRAEENGSKGTDHGAAAPTFLLGSGVRGGLHGSAPDLSRLVDGDVHCTTDFRSLYTTLERDWMGLAPSTKLDALPLVARS